VDDAAPSDRELWYVVRAESDESCASGPANGGAMDDNLVRVRALESTSQPTPGGVPGLQVTLLGGAHVQLSWAAASSAGSYNVYRSTLPDGSDRVLVGETSELFFEDRHSGANKTTYFYDVVAVNACGVEGP
jgi:fibronectin type 3 domain-containing protein